MEREKATLAGGEKSNILAEFVIKLLWIGRITINNWFTWKGNNCTEYGIHVTQQPEIIRPQERATFTSVPGRSGTLTTLEGADVYDD